jgi:hypothetical protein
MNVNDFLISPLFYIMNIQFGIIKHFGDLKTEAFDVNIVYVEGLMW